MYRHFIPFGRLMNNFSPATENIPLQSFKLVHRKQNLVIYRLAHNNHQSMRSKKKGSEELFNKLREVKVQSEYPKKLKNYQMVIEKNDNPGYEYNVVRKVLLFMIKKFESLGSGFRILGIVSKMVLYV